MKEALHVWVSLFDDEIKGKYLPAVRVARQLQVKHAGGRRFDQRLVFEENSEYTIQAGSDIEAKFVHLATLSAGNNIVVKEYMCHSYVKSGNQLLVGHKAGKGRSEEHTSELQSH